LIFGTISSSVEWNGAPGAARLSVRRRRDDDRRPLSSLVKVYEQLAGVKVSGGEGG
jgi:hypothetical protein